MPKKGHKITKPLESISVSTIALLSLKLDKNIQTVFFVEVIMNVRLASLVLH